MQQHSPVPSSSSPYGSPYSGKVPHPLHKTPVGDPLFSSSGSGGGTFDNQGNYFNEDLLLARAQGSKARGSDPLEGGGRNSNVGQEAWGGEALRDSAGKFLNSARYGRWTAKFAMMAKSVSVVVFQRHLNNILLAYFFFLRVRSLFHILPILFFL